MTQSAPIKTPCPLCGGRDLRDIFHLRDVPVICNELWPDEAAARDAALCDMDLAFCPSCGLVSNRTFDPDLITYAPGYENALHFSPRFQTFARELCEGLVARHGLKGRDVVEVGCGDGHILDLLAKSGVRSATGFDPSMAGKPSPFTEEPGVEIVPEYFRSDHLDRPFDMLICRHVLEHLPDPYAILTEMRAAIGERDCPVYFEVPNGQWMLESCSMWDVIYEHVTYWSPPSLETLFRRTGFTPITISAGYDGQFLMIEARPSTPEPDFLAASEEVAEIAKASASFASSAEAVLGEWRGRLEDLARDGRNAVIWGAGSKGITFANAVGVDGCLAAMVDINQRKHGRYVPGVALPVTGPDGLAAINPDLVLIANELYADEISQSVRDRGLAPEFGVIVG
ncbi:methyltransferase domain-containing protein [Rhodobacteraceae bacterium NNCM2]|nr:methyltransferase domain-containing protein [Coraliihabitans acroporae]